MNTGSPARTPALLISLLAAVMAGLALLIAAPAILAEPEAAVPGLEWLVLVPLFALAEVVVIHLPTQRNAHGHTMREIPAVLGLTFMVPQQYVTAYVVGAVLALVLAARMRGVKLAFNAAMFSLEAALGALVYHAILQGGDPLSMTGWLAVLLAVLVTDLISAGAVTAAISLTEGVFDGEVLHEALRSGSFAAFINTCVALLFATLVLVQPSALPLLGVVIVLLVMAYRVYISLARGHARTHLLYRFVDRTASAGTPEEIIGIVVREAADLMHAERAYLVELVGDHEVRCTAYADGSLRTESLELPEPRTWWWSAIERGVVRYETPRGHGQREDPAPTVGPAVMSAPRDGLAAPLRTAEPTRYVLVVCDRSFEKETFGTEDVQVFEALAAHAGVAVERARSVNDLEELAEELKGARDAALAASEAKSMFLANMSHEIRTPLTTVLAAGELLEETTLDQMQAKLLDRMRQSGGLLLSLVESLLDFSRIEAGHASLQQVEFDLHAMVRDIVDASLPRAQQRGNTLDWVIDPLVPRTVIGDRTRVVQVLSNLVDNALKFTANGRVHVEVGAAVVAGSRAVQFEVSDTGIGIDEKDQASIFEAFRQVDGSATRHYAGTGLGLAICKQLTDLMGGNMTVTGQLDVGSTFTFQLPLAVPAKPPAVLATRPPSLDRASREA
ncbi:GAF domain-containing hybrid sensor histidine kinase/response regulator [Nocardioides sp. 616]|uniref:sensor histidine kinase n=1 Tax=Nocardioides sp. 616 TaxID=2268090 RepID=UPI000CE510AD|nr:GAF domain-containing hybrid sensor histidine kinase/response regulator [Nocardioides sp. 616]